MSRGSQPGERRGGRKAGTPNKTTVERTERARIMAEVEARIPDAFPGDALAYLASIYKDPRQQPPLRLEAARIAIAYEQVRTLPAPDDSLTES